jgi:hypothetical protein
MGVHRGLTVTGAPISQTLVCKIGQRTAKCNGIFTCLITPLELVKSRKNGLVKQQLKYLNDGIVHGSEKVLLEAIRSLNKKSSARSGLSLYKLVKETPRPPQHVTIAALIGWSW